MGQFPESAAAAIALLVFRQVEVAVVIGALVSILIFTTTEVASVRHWDRIFVGTTMLAYIAVVSVHVVYLSMVGPVAMATPSTASLSVCHIDFNIQDLAAIQ